MISSKKLMASLLLASTASIVACTPSNQANLPTTPSASTEPTEEASEEPTEEANESTSPGTEPQELPDSTSSTTPDSSVDPAVPTVTEPGDGKITISGADTFDAYPVEFKVGMKWVYSMKNEIAIPQISIPGGLPPGVSIPGLSAQAEIPGFGISSFSDLGTLTMEVINVTGSTVTIKTTTDISIAGAPEVEPTESTFDKSKGTSGMYSEQLASGQEGSLSFSKVASGEAVSVGAGSYTADRIKGIMNVTADANGNSVDFDQESLIWMTAGVGMVKQETKSTVESSGTTTTLIELISFKG